MIRLRRLVGTPHVALALHASDAPTRIGTLGPALLRWHAVEIPVAEPEAPAATPDRHRGEIGG